MPEQPDIIGGPGVAAYQELYETISAVIVPLGVTGASTVTELLAAIVATQDKGGA